MILSIADEGLLDQIKIRIVNAKSQENTGNKEKTIEKYQTKVVEKLDLELIKKEQNYKSPSIIEIEKLINEADIQEPIEELLKMI